MARRPLALLLLAAVAASALLGAARADEEARPAPVEPDFAFYKARIAPIVEQVCAECHSDPRKRLGRHFLRPRQGQPVRERDHERNFRTILGLIVPGDPSKSLWLLKPLGPRQGGVEHGGGERILFDSLEYGLMIDFINGAKYEAPPFRPPPTEPGQPDFRYFMEHVEPVLQTVCCECHAERSRGAFRQLRVPEEGRELTLEDHYENFRSVLVEIVPGRPERSKFLLKPLALADGGLPHKGGDRIFPGDERHRAWTAFIRGEVGPPLPSERPGGPPEIPATGGTLEAEAQTLAGASVERTPAGDVLVVPGPAGGNVTAVFRVAAEATYELTVRLRGPGAGPTLRLDRMAPLALGAPASGFADVGPAVLLDGDEPLLGLQGEVRPVESRVEMRGRGAEPARWLSPVEIPHRAVEMRFALPAEADGGDDAWLLFDMDDALNGKFLGLVDGGRRAVIGLLEGGQPRVLKAAPAPPPGAGVLERTLRVDYVEGVAVGRLDGEALVFANLDQALDGAGRFGAQTHGPLTIVSLEAYEDWVVHAVKARAAPLVALAAGAHVLRLDLPPGGAAVDRIFLKELGR